jgi:hypothetical protein
MKRQEMLLFAIILIVMVMAYNLSGCFTGEAVPPAATSSLRSDDQEPQIATLESLDSYRAHRTVWLVTDNFSEEVNMTTAECVREPLGNVGIEEEVAIGHTIWHKEMLDSWEITKSDQRVHEAIAAAQTFWGFTISEITDPLCSDCKVRVDEETVNGIRCKHYVLDRGVPTLHVEVWIADQIDLPPVLVRGVRQEKEKNIDLYTEVNLTDINKPFTIQPPE